MHPVFPFVFQENGRHHTKSYGLRLCHRRKESGKTTGNSRRGIIARGEISPIQQTGRACFGEYPKSAFTSNFDQKPSAAGRVPLERLRPIKVEALEIEKVHRGRVLYCRIISKVVIMKAAAVLVEDDNALAELAVYGMPDPGDLSEGRRLAISEPYFKTRMDGSKGIRVDNPEDITFDVDCPNETVEAGPRQSLSLDKRLKEILERDSSIGVDKLYQTLVREGYSVTKMQTRALKASFKKQPSENIVPILSDRRPEKHLLISIPQVLAHRKAGNEAFQAGEYEKAEEEYSAALELKGSDSSEEAKDTVALWQLYGNRCAARLKLGMLDEALRDSLASNMYAPADELKPILRCAEAMFALGMDKESHDLLEAATKKFPVAKNSFAEKKLNLSRKSTFFVGQDKKFNSIQAALWLAPPGSEIVVDPGVYSEPLLIFKPVTIRPATMRGERDAIEAVEGDDSSWVEIRVTGNVAINCNIKSFHKPVHILGCKITCEAPISTSMHAVFTTSGLVVLRHCFLTSSSGPVIAAICPTSRIIIHFTAITRGAQGGILIDEGAKLSMHQVHCCHNAASGVEFREGGEGTLEACHVYNNGTQGVLVWKKAGRLVARDCLFYSHSNESGVMLSEGEAILEKCQVFGNAFAGVVTQQAGNLYALKCHAHDNLEGILIQDTGKARVEKCNIHSSRANGIFIGYDHRGSAAITDNLVKDNICRGVLVGNSGKVVVRRNEESGNKGLPPFMPNSIYGRQLISSNFVKFIKKNRETIAKAAREQNADGLLDSMMSAGEWERVILNVDRALEKWLLQCAFCKAEPEGEKFARWAKCHQVSYCSRECQKAHWSEHKTKCRPKSVKYPSFVDNNMSV